MDVQVVIVREVLPVAQAIRVHLRSCPARRLALRLLGDQPRDGGSLGSDTMPASVVVERQRLGGGIAHPYAGAWVVEREQKRWREAFVAQGGCEAKESGQRGVGSERQRPTPQRPRPRKRKTPAETLPQA